MLTWASNVVRDDCELMLQNWFLLVKSQIWWLLFAFGVLLNTYFIIFKKLLTTHACIWSGISRIWGLAKHEKWDWISGHCKQWGSIIQSVTLAYYYSALLLNRWVSALAVYTLFSCPSGLFATDELPYFGPIRCFKNWFMYWQVNTCTYVCIF